VPEERQVGGPKHREGVEEFGEHGPCEGGPGILVVTNEPRRVLRQDGASAEGVGDLGIPQMTE
jgi:hypothetical protein